MLSPAIVLGLRGVQALFAIIVLGLSAYLVDKLTTPWASYSPARLNFMLFTSVWTLLVVAFLVLVPTRFPRAAHKFLIAGVEFVSMVFWFVAFVAMAVLWHDVYSYWGAYHGTFYGAGVAAIVFAAFLWLTFVVTAALSLFHVRDTSSHDTSPPPQMAGV